MASVLRVDPTALRAAAQTQTGVATTISTMAVDESMTSAADGVSGLESAAMCQLAGELFRTATAAAHEELAAHSGKLSTAADLYQRTDEELGDRLRRFVR